MPNKDMNDFEKYWSCRNMLKFIANIAACENYNFEDKNNIKEVEDGIMEYTYNTQDAANVFNTLSLAIMNHISDLDGEARWPCDPGLDEIVVPDSIDQPPRGAVKKG